MNPDLSQFSEYPRFADGRIDYREAPVAAALDCVVHCKGKILLLKRSEKVGFAKGVWHVIAGFVDAPISVEEQAMIELREETGITDVKSVITVAPRIFRGKTKEWIIYPVIIELESEPEIKLDWEHTEYRWIELDEVKEYKLLPGVAEIILLIR